MTLACDFRVIDTCTFLPQHWPYLIGMLPEFLLFLASLIESRSALKQGAGSGIQGAANNVVNLSPRSIPETNKPQRSVTLSSGTIVS